MRRNAATPQRRTVATSQRRNVATAGGAHVATPRPIPYGANPSATRVRAVDDLPNNDRDPRAQRHVQVAVGRISAAVAIRLPHLLVEEDDHRLGKGHATPTIK